jgi:hypothetical protein
VQPGAQVTDDGIDIKGHRPVIGPQADGAAAVMAGQPRTRTEIKHQPAGLARAPRQPGAAGVQRPDLANETVVRQVRVPADDYVGGTSR